MGEHPFETQILEAERRTDVVEVFGIKAVAVHAGIDGEVGLAGGFRLAQELVECHSGADIRNGCSQLEFNKVGEVRRCAGAEYQNRQIHSVLAEPSLMWATPR